MNKEKKRKKRRRGKKTTKKVIEAFRKFQLEVQEGKHQCKYCGEIAKHLLYNHIPCCMPYSKQCPAFRYWLSERFKQRYKDHPELYEQRSRISKRVNNRPSVKEKKSNAMKRLHRDDCDACKNFQYNYAKGREKFRETLNKDSEE